MSNEQTHISGSTVATHDGTILNAPSNTGNVGVASRNSRVSQSNSNGIQAGDLNALIKTLRQANIAEKDLDTLKTSIESEPTNNVDGTLGEKVGAWMGNMIQKAATGTWAIAVDQGSILLNNAINAFYGIS